MADIFDQAATQSVSGDIFDQAATQPPRGFLSRLANDQLPPPTGYVDAASRGLADVGQGVFQVADAIRHPIDTASKLTEIGPKVMDFLSGSGEHTGQNPIQSTAEIVKNAADNPAEAGHFASNQIGQIAAGMGIGEGLSAAGKIPAGKIASGMAKRAGPATKAVGKLAVQDAASHIPVAGRLVQRPSLFDYWKALKTAPEAPAPPTPDPAAVSPSRTMPGQHVPEVTNPPKPVQRGRLSQLLLPEQTPSTIEGAANSPSRSIGGEKTVNRTQTAAPIPPRSTQDNLFNPVQPSQLALPAAPRGAELGDLPARNAKPAAQTGEALGTIRGSSAVQTSKPIQRGSLSQLLQQQLNEGLGAAPPPNPKAPIYQRGQLSSAMQEGSDVPQGHTAVEGSSAIRSKMYDPEAREFHARLTSGDTTYVYGDVSPEEASGFEGAKSKGQAFQAMKANHPLVAKIVNGKRMPIRAGQPLR